MAHNSSTARPGHLWEAPIGLCKVHFENHLGSPNLLTIQKAFMDHQQCATSGGLKEKAHTESQPFQLLSFFFFFNVYFWDRERQSMNRGGAEREGDTESETGPRV